MKITGLTTCVGEHYAKMLGKSLPIWLNTLDDLRIITDHETKNRYMSGFPPSKIYPTEIFTAHSASFNKGAALSQGFANIKDPDWILNFDADILPPANWRTPIEAYAYPDPTKLYGCSHRYREDGSLIPDADFPNIWGFFHLWNVADPHSWRRPVFDPTCGHAGNYDHTFMTQWPVDSRVDLWPELKLIHQGEPRQKWFGNDEKNDKKMMNLFTLGLWDAWLTRAGHIKPPEPEVIVTIDKTYDPKLALEILSQYTESDPFRCKVVCK